MRPRPRSPAGTGAFSRSRPAGGTQLPARHLVANMDYYPTFGEAAGHYQWWRRRRAVARAFGQAGGPLSSPATSRPTAAPAQRLASSPPTGVARRQSPASSNRTSSGPLPGYSPTCRGDAGGRGHHQGGCERSDGAGMGRLQLRDRWGSLHPESSKPSPAPLCHPLTTAMPTPPPSTRLAGRAAFGPRCGSHIVQGSRGCGVKLQEKMSRKVRPTDSQPNSIGHPHPHYREGQRDRHPIFHHPVQRALESHTTEWNGGGLRGGPVH